MSAKTFIERQLLEVQQGGCEVLFRKMKQSLQILLKPPLYILAVPIVLMLHLIRPWMLVRWGGLISTRIGHFAANTEMYLCERAAGINMPKQRHVDIFYYMEEPVCNQQLATMWKRVLRIWPSWILTPIIRVNRLIPGGEVHEIGNNTQGARDVHNLLERFPPYLEFTPAEVARGEAGLRAMGIPPGTPFVCLNVRDSGYLEAYKPGGEWTYHNYRDSDIQNFILAAEELADRGFFVIRMGAIVREAMKTDHPKVIDYAMNGMRSDFMDIYLGAKCNFCVSTGTGWDNIPASIFRRPLVDVNFGPIGYIPSYLKNTIFIIKHHYLVEEKRNLTMREIFNHGVGFCLSTFDYECKGIKLIENTPEEILEVVIEIAERLNGTWQPLEDDEVLQRRFWEIFPIDAVDHLQGRPLHGRVCARFGAQFLRNNCDWLQ